MIKVSIIIPIYNVEKYLRECLDSVVNQTLSEIEIICVNDGSKDNCLEIIQEYAKVDSRIKILNKDNSGYGDSMNKGIELATGEYIGIVEPDDYVEKDMFQKLYSKAKEYDADIVKSNFFILQDSNKDKKITLVMLDESKKYYDKLLSPIKNLNVYRFPMYTWSGIYKREFINKNNIKHNTTPGASFQDNGFFFQTFSLAKTVYFINEAFYYYRWDNPNASGNQSRRNNLIKSKKEYDFIRTFVDKHSELNPNILYAYNWQKFHMYSSWIDDTSVDLFVQMAHQEFKAAYRNKEINYNLYSREQKRMLKTIIEHPYRYNDIWNKQDSNKFYQNIFSIKNEGVHKVIMLLGMKFKFRSSHNTYEIINSNLDVINKKLNEISSRMDFMFAKSNYLVNTSLRTYNLHQKVFPKYKNINQGKDVVLIATGPSLKNFKIINDAIYLGVNKAFQYDKVKFDYLFLQDYSGATKTYIDDFCNYNTIKFIGHLNYPIETKCIIPDKYLQYPNVEHYYNIHPSYQQYFTYDIATQPLGDAYSIVFPAMQFILWTNPKRIYLVGCDCNMGGYHDSSDKNNLAVNEVIDGWKRMKEFAETYYPDTEIISINPVGLKGVFKDEFTEK